MNERGEIKTNTKEIQTILRNIVWTIIGQQTRQSGRNESIPRDVQTTKTETGRNTKPEQTCNQQGKLKQLSKISQQKNSKADGFPGELYQTFKEELIPTLLKEFQKYKNGRKTSKLFLWHQHYIDPKDRQRSNKKGELRTNIPDEHDAKTLTKILANRIQWYIKRIIHHNQVGFIPGLQGWFSIHKSINVIYNT